MGPFLLPDPLLYSQEQPGPSQLQLHRWEKDLKPCVGPVCTFRTLPGVGTFPDLPLFVPSTRVSHLFVYCPHVRDVFPLIWFF